MADSRQSVILIGMPGSGKTTVGKALARRLDFAFCDADDELVRRTGVSIATIFEIEGESGFRRREAQLLGELALLPRTILATGGGVVLCAENRTVLRRCGRVVYLRAPIEELVRRTARDKRRPLLLGVDAGAKLRELLVVREPLYREVAEIVVESTPRDPGRLADQIVAALGLTHPR